MTGTIHMLDHRSATGRRPAPAISDAADAAPIAAAADRAAPRLAGLRAVTAVRSPGGRLVVLPTRTTG